MLELTFKSSFEEMDPEITSRPIFAIHSLNPCYYVGPGSKIVQKCETTKFDRPPKADDPLLDNYEDFVKFWPPLQDSSIPDYMGYWLYQLYKHGTHKQFPGDFL
ncbi:hypothetical protein POM88_022733 [Heracleum sosnowskyi]|uniref:Uncharacterized protein n=1 Tax=Heracleum sosnowskyi TaxID=360622 RepID=A0AAD8IGY3_9APIA|nr:hypothetical protein POM88_022733 [Heracleum sosnowskyi]